MSIVMATLMLNSGFAVNRVFLLGGQSNMVGQGLSGELPAELLVPNPRVLIFENGKWQPLRPLKHTFGPEVAFAALYAPLGRSQK